MEFWSIMSLVKNAKSSSILFFVWFKVEAERSKVACVSREKQNVHEKWLDLERKVEKFQHDLGVKETLQVRISEHI